MQRFSTSADCDAWLVSLLAGFKATSHGGVVKDSQLLADVERYLRNNTRSTHYGSQVFH